MRPEWILDLRDEGIQYRQGEGAVFDFPNPTSATLGNLTSRHQHDLRNSAFTVHIAEAIPEIATYIALESSITSNTPSAAISVTQGEMRFAVNRSLLATLDYDASRDKVWRIREQEGTLFFETGPSEEEMTLRSETIAYGEFDPSHVKAKIGVVGNDVPPGRVVFGSVTPQSPPTTYCSATSFRAPFSGSELGPQWSPIRASDECEYAVADGELKIYGERDLLLCPLHTERA